MKDVETILNNLTLDEMIGQMLCFDFSAPNLPEQEMENIIKQTHAGSFFVAGVDSKRIKTATQLVEKYTKLPALVAADIENGPGSVFGPENETPLPHPMTWGACDDPELIEQAHVATAERCRELGIHWSFAPIVDINMNPNNPDANIRAISDKPEQVVKIASAVIRGLQKNGLIAAGCKHFPGDGVDDRNQHFCTTVNSLSKEEWMNTFGYVYKKLIQEGTSSIMVAHIALPAYDEKLNDWVGYPPGSLSYNLQTKLLRETLGFEGVIVSDAMSMVGACAAVHPDRVAVEFVKAGGDMILFPKTYYFDQVREAVLSGEISEERIRDAVRRVLKMKEKVRLFEPQENVLRDIKHEHTVEEMANAIAEKSVTLIRNYADAVPVNIKPGDTVLLIQLQREVTVNYDQFQLTTLEEEFKKRGFVVKSYVNPGRPDIEEDMKKAAAVFVNIKISCKDYCGGNLRTDWIHIATLWRGELLRHPNCIFASFGDPYKLYEYPYVKTYLNVYSPTPESQRAYVKAVLGEIPIQGKSPVSLKGFFEAEV